jgi:hypothetical protein
MAQKQKCKLSLYRDFLIANQNRYSGLELSKVEPSRNMSHDSVTRFLMRRDFQPKDVWRFAKPLVEEISPDLSGGYLIGDDTVIAKPFARENELATWQYSGQKHDIVNGMGLVNLLYSTGAGADHIPVDYRLYSPTHDGKNKNDHFKDMLDVAGKRGFHPDYVLMDSWYGSLDNLKHIKRKGWHWITNLKSNRLISVVQGEHMAVSNLDLEPGTVRRVWLKGYGFVNVARIDFRNEDARYLATDDLELTDYDTYVSHWETRWQIETFHRGLKQALGVDGCSARRAQAQRTHIFACICAFLKLEARRLHAGLTWYEQKARIHREATRAFLATA